MVKKQQKPHIVSRPPIVTILGHVDHGKTSLLDTIRKTNIAQKEHGGITQHIGAYQIKTSKSNITFIDTPGHQAFAKMRGRGAQVADIAILVVAANDGVMPQTIESIELIKNSKIPAIVAVNKIDLPDINIEKIKKQLVKHGLKLEEYGGDVPVVSVSAKTGQGIDKLLEMILLLSELSEVKEDSSFFQAVVIESTLSKNKGAIATIIVRNGSLHIGDEIICDDQEFKTRALVDWLGQNRDKISSGDPVEILGWKKVPDVGTIVYKKDEKILKKEAPVEPIPPISDKPIEQTDVPQEKEGEKIKLIIRSDNSGTLEAIIGSLPKKVIVIDKGVGNVKESDIFLAKISKALVIGFNIKTPDSVNKLAETEKVILKTYNIIYELLDEIDDVVEAALTGNLVKVLGEARIVAIFDIKGQKVGGIKVISGRIARGDLVKIVRKDQEIKRSKIKSLRHGKEDITKAEMGSEAGIILSENLEYLTGDSIIAIG